MYLLQPWNCIKEKIDKEISNTQPDQEPPPPPALTPRDDRIHFRTPAYFVSVDEEEIINHQLTRVSPRNINFSKNKEMQEGMHTGQFKHHNL